MIVRHTKFYQLLKQRRILSLLRAEFDEGHLCENKEQAQREADILTQIMTVGLGDDEYPDDLPRARALRYAFRSVWERISQVT